MAKSQKAIDVSLHRLTALLVLALLLGWPGLPGKHCCRLQNIAHNCCAEKQKSCCEPENKPKICRCEKRSNLEVALVPAATPLALVLHVSLVLDLFQVKQVVSSAIPTHRLYEARGPTELGMTATQVALPPPA